MTSWEKVWGAPTGEVFLMGQEGLIYRQNGAVWDSLNSGPAFDRIVHAAWGDQGNNMYFVGGISDRDTTYFDTLVDSNVTVPAPDKPFVKQYNGISFVDAPIGDIAWGLYDIWGSSANNIYAVGYNGTIIHYDGVNWTTVFTGGVSPARLLGVWGTSAGNIFACGTGGALLHYDGAVWTVVRTHTQYDLWDLWGPSADTLYMVGAHGTIIRYTTADSTMTRMETGLTNSLYGIWGTAANNIYVAGWGGKILHYNGAAWTVETSLTNFGFLSVWATSPSDVYVAGDAVLHYDGASWTPVRVRKEPDFNDVWAGTQSLYAEAVAVGTSGRIMRSAGGDAFTLMTVDGGTVTTNFNGVGGFSDTAWFAVGNGGVIVKRDEADLTNWVTASSCVLTNLKAVAVLSRNIAWAVGAGGTLLKWDGSAWNVQTSLTGEDLNDVWIATTATDTLVCAVGNSGTAYWYNGSWNGPATGTTDNITSVTGTSSGDFFAVTDGERLLRLHAGVWNTAASGIGESLTSVWTDDAGTLIMCGESGSAYTYSLHTGSVAPLSTTIGFNLRGVYGFSAANFYAVGDYNHVLHYRP